MARCPLIFIALGMTALPVYSWPLGKVHEAALVT